MGRTCRYPHHLLELGWVTESVTHLNWWEIFILSVAPVTLQVWRHSGVELDRFAPLEVELVEPLGKVEP